MLTKSDVNDCMALAVATFPRYPLAKSQVEAYYELLRDLDIDKADLLAALSRVIQTSSFFPTVAQIREELRPKPTSTAPVYGRDDTVIRGLVPMPDAIKTMREFFRSTTVTARNTAIADRGVQHFEGETS